MASTTTSKKELIRRPDDGLIAGVCAGLAEYFDVNVVVVRAVFVGLLAFNGFGLLAYLAFVFLLNVGHADDGETTYRNGSPLQDVSTSM